MKRSLLVGVVAASLSGPLLALAGAFGDFERDLRDAYGQHRTAMFQSNSGNRNATSQAMEALAQKWAAIGSTWGQDPPPQYLDDPAFRDTLAAMSVIIDQASKEISEGVRSGDSAAISAAVDGLKVPYAKLFAKFG